MRTPQKTIYTPVFKCQFDMLLKNVSEVQRSYKICILENLLRDNIILHSICQLHLNYKKIKKYILFLHLNNGIWIFYQLFTMAFKNSLMFKSFSFTPTVSSYSIFSSLIGSWSNYTRSSFGIYAIFYSNTPSVIFHLSKICGFI